MYEDETIIPKARIAVLVGVKGKAKRQIEKLTRTNLKIDSKQGIITITSEDIYDLQVSKSIVKAIGRGFNPDVALQLSNQEYYLEIIKLQSFARKSKTDLERIKARCIGSKGKTRNIIEEITQTNTCIYGKTIAIIGLPENVLIAKQAFESLLRGAKHGNVYKMLENSKSKLKKEL